jgi:predicted Zn-dependent peptidase
MLQGKDSRLYQALVQKNGLTGDVNGGINELGNMFNINGPVLWDVSLIHDKDKSEDQVLKVFDAEIEKLRTQPVDQATLDRALVKKRSWFYDKMEQFNGFGKADMLASLALFDDDPKKINQIEAEFRKVTPALIQKTAQTYLAPENRTILVIVPKGDAKESPAGAPAKSGK